MRIVIDINEDGKVSTATALPETKNAISTDTAGAFDGGGSSSGAREFSVEPITEIPLQESNATFNGGPA